MTFYQTEQQEKVHLQQVISIINDTIHNTDTSVKEHVETLQEYKDYIWSNKDIDPHEIRSMRESILNHFALGESVIDKRKRLGRFCVFCQYFGFGSSPGFTGYSAGGGVCAGLGSFSFLGRFFQTLRRMNTTATAISSTGHR